MRTIILFCICVAMLSCSSKSDVNTQKQEVFATEKSFEKMCADSGICVAFTEFADSDAVILRGNDSIISGKAGIKHFYDNEKYRNARVQWTADVVNISEDGSLAWTYGKYVWTVKNQNGTENEFKGVFYTVWKKQKDGSWKYVWD
mgnify:FL=1